MLFQMELKINLILNIDFRKTTLIYLMTGLILTLYSLFCGHQVRADSNMVFITVSYQDTNGNRIQEVDDTITVDLSKSSQYTFTPKQFSTYTLVNNGVTQDGVTINKNMDDTYTLIAKPANISTNPSKVIVKYQSDTSNKRIIHRMSIIKNSTGGYDPAGSVQDFTYTVGQSTANIDVPGAPSSNMKLIGVVIVNISNDLIPISNPPPTVYSINTTGSDMTVNFVFVADTSQKANVYVQTLDNLVDDTGEIQVVNGLDYIDRSTKQVLAPDLQVLVNSPSIDNTVDMSNYSFLKAVLENQGGNPPDLYTSSDYTQVSTTNYTSNSVAIDTSAAYWYVHYFWKKKSSEPTKNLTLTLNASPEAGGSVAGKDTANSSGKSFTLTLPADSNGQATFTGISATPNSPYTWVDWDKTSGNVVSSFDYTSRYSQSITISSNTVLNAYFANDDRVPTVKIRTTKTGEDGIYTTIRTNSQLTFGVVGYDRVDPQYKMTYWYEISDGVNTCTVGKSGDGHTVNSSLMGITGDLNIYCSTDTNKQGRYVNGLGGPLTFSKTGTYTVTVHITNTIGKSAMDVYTVKVTEDQDGKLIVQYKVLSPPDTKIGQRLQLDTSLYSSSGTGIIQDKTITVDTKDGDAFYTYTPEFTGYWTATDKGYTVKMISYTYDQLNYNAVLSQSDVPGTINVKVPQGGTTTITYLFDPEAVSTSSQVKIKYVVHDMDQGSVIGIAYDKDGQSYPDKIYNAGDNYTRQAKDVKNILTWTLGGSWSIGYNGGNYDYTIKAISGEDLNVSNGSGSLAEDTILSKTVSNQNPNIIDVYIASNTKVTTITQKIVTVDVDADKPTSGNLSDLVSTLPTTNVSETEMKLGSVADMKVTSVTAPATYLYSSGQWMITAKDLTTEAISQAGLDDYEKDVTIAPYTNGKTIQYMATLISPYTQGTTYTKAVSSKITGDSTISAPSVIYTYYIKYRNSSTPKIYYSTDGNGTIKITNSANDKSVYTNSSTQEKTVLIKEYDNFNLTAETISTDNPFIELKAWGGQLAEQTEDTAHVYTATRPTYSIISVPFNGSMQSSDIAKFNGAHFKAIFKGTDKPPVDPPTTGEVGKILFDPNSCSWTNKGKITEGTGSYPVRAYYEGDNPVHGTGIATIHHYEVVDNPPNEDGSSNPPTIIDYTYQENVDVTFQLASITVSGDASAFISGASGNVNITKEGKALRLHGVGAWADGVAAQPTVGANESVMGIQIPPKPTQPVGDSGEYNIDWTRPDINIDPPNSLWVNNPTPYPVHITITDNLSGFDGNSTVTVTDSSHYGRNASDTLTMGALNYNKTLELYDGIYTVVINTGDIATNTHSITSQTYYVDQTQAEVSFSVNDSIFNEANGATKEMNGDVPTLYGVLTFSDNLSGVNKAQYSWTFGDLDYGSYTDLTASGGSHYSCLGGASNMYKYTYFDRYLERPQFKIEKPVGDYLFLHVKIWDVAGNYTYKTFGPFEDPIKIKNFEVTDICDPSWSKIFWQDDNYTIPTKYVYPVSRLPIDNNSNPIYKGAEVKKGYAFNFDIMSEFMYRDNDSIVIYPTYYYWDGKNRTPCDMYYNLYGNPFVKAGSTQDILPINLLGANLSSSGQFIGNLTKLTLTKSVRTFRGRPFYDPGGWKGEVQYDDGKLQLWYGEYFIPSNAKFVPKGVDPRPENVLNKNWIIVNFNIIGYKDGKETQGTNQVSYYIPNQWINEGGPKQPIYDPGDVILYDLKHSAVQDRDTRITH